MPRLLYIDILRVLACFLVILTHSAMPHGQGEHFMSVVLLAFLGSASSELFISLSGGVLLPVKTDIKSFYKRRFLKLMPPIFFWSMVVVILNVIRIPETRTLSYVVQSILFLPFQQVDGIYWFVYVMIGLYLFAPFISKWLQDATQREVLFFIALWFFTLLMPYFRIAFDHFCVQYDTHYFELTYFGGFLGYWLIGYYLRRYPIKIGLNWPFVLVTAAVVAYVAFLVGFRYFSGESPGFIMNDNLQVGSACMVIFLYTIAQNIHIRSQALVKAITDVAKMSFGIYLMHFIVIRNVVWPVFFHTDFPPALQTIAIALTTMALCYIVVKAISYLPGSKYIVGA